MRPVTTSLCTCLALLALVGRSLAAEAPEPWPGWRGPRRDGTAAAAPLWPRELDSSRLVKLWRVELAESYSGPVVWGDLVFVTETRDRKEEVVRALETASGKEVWKAAWKGSLSVPFFAAANGSWIRATPATDGETLYVAGIRDVLVALEVKTGKERWRADLVERYGAELPTFGFVCSPLLDGEFLYTQAGAAVLKLRKSDGSTVWRSLEDGGGMNGSAFSSPVLAEAAGRRQLLVQTRQKLAGLDPENGELLWSQEVPAFQGMNILTPTALGSRLFTSSYGGATYAFDLVRNGEKIEIKEAWKENTQGYMSSPVVIDGKAYLPLRNQRLACFDIQGGKRLWTSKETFGKYMSLVAQGDRILALDERGKLLLLRANPEKLEKLGEVEVSEEPTWAHLAVVGNRLYIRSLKALAAFEWKGADAR